MDDVDISMPVVFLPPAPSRQTLFFVVEWQALKVPLHSPSIGLLEVVQMGPTSNIPCGLQNL